MASILIVDDEQKFAEAFSEYLSLQGHHVASANTLSAAQQMLTTGIPDVLLLDLMLPDGSGLELFETFADKRPQKIVIVTGHAGVKALIGGMVGDGVTYMQKPVEPHELVGLINTVDAKGSDSPAHREERSRFDLLIGDSEAMQSVYKAIERVASTDSTVLIQGESGTGKELVADSIHRQSGRPGAFVPVNCGGLTKELISSQLFGHEKGSFTGASQQQAGFFERAGGGTLFLDEITEMPIDMQTHLLRVLESGRITRVGSTAEIDVDARLVAATNREPSNAVAEGELREDLYFRLSVFPIYLPPLRERGADITLLAEQFLKELNEKNGTLRAFDDEAHTALTNHHWPGNVRELRHVVHRAWIMAEDDTLRIPGMISPTPVSDVEGLRAGRTIADVERDLIFATLRQLDGDKKAAAASLGISLKTLYNRLNDYGEA